MDHLLFALNTFGIGAKLSKARRVEAATDDCFLLLDVGQRANLGERRRHTEMTSASGGAVLTRQMEEDLAVPKILRPNMKQRWQFVLLPFTKKRIEDMDSPPPHQPSGFLQDRQFFGGQPSNTSPAT